MNTLRHRDKPLIPTSLKLHVPARRVALDPHNNLTAAIHLLKLLTVINIWVYSVINF